MMCPEYESCLSCFCPEILILRFMTHFIKFILNSSKELIDDAHLLGIYCVPKPFPCTFSFPLAIIAFRKS